MFDWKVQKLDFQIHINIPQPKVLHILDASNIIIGLKINNIVANIIRIHSFVLITLRGFFKSDYVQPQTHNSLNANFRVSGNVKRVKGLGGGGRLFEAGHLLTFSTVRMGAYSRRVLTRGWALIRIIR